MIHQYYRNKNSHPQTTIHNGPSTIHNQTIKKYKALTYTKNISEQIEKVVKTYCPDIQIAHKTTNSIRNIYTKLKDKIPQHKQTNIVYKIPCLGNIETGTDCNLCYVGQTKQYLEKRVNNHKNDLRLAHNSSQPKTALIEHCLSHNHTPDFNSTSILAKANNFNRRLTMEALHIIEEDSMNLKKDSDHIAPLFCALINDPNIKRTRKRTRTLTHTQTEPTQQNKKRRTQQQHTSMLTTHRSPS